MSKFVHLHVHSQYSLLDGQASVPGIVDKAMADGMPAVALTDHGVMYGIKEFINYVNKKNKGTKSDLKDARKRLAALEDGAEPAEGESIEGVRAKIAELEAKIFKPIIGCEMYVAKGSLTERGEKDFGRHLVVLAKNKKGYQNLIKLVSKSWTDGYYYHPRTDKASLAAHREGLIICSACLGGEIPKLLTAGLDDEAERSVQWWKETFGDDYYLELQRHKATVERANHETYRLQKEIEPKIIALAQKYGIKLIATNDSHFVNESDAEAHDHLICVSTKVSLDDPKRMLYTKQEWLKTTEEMTRLFADIPEAIENTLEIAAKVEEYSIDHGPIMPNFAIPEDFGTEAEYRNRITEQELFDEFTRDEKGNVVLSQEAAEDKIKKLGGYDKLYRIKFEADYLRKLAYEGAAKRYPMPLAEDVDERINFELHIMKTMGFPGYFLIVQDFIREGREKLDVSIGPGRGSAAGSVVAYCLGITQIDPLKYDLLFERFLNPDRISLPDIDVDFDDEGRKRVLDYVTRKYGAPNVAHIITYGTMAAKMAVKDVARVEQLPIPEANRLTKLIPAHMPMKDGKELKPTLANCYEYVDDFKPELQSPNPAVRSTLRFARELEGNVRGTGVHACGVIICRDDVSDWVPVGTAEDKEEGKLLVTQYEGSVIEETGLIKMDFLGLKTLSIIKTALANIKASRGEVVDIDNIPIDDAATYRLYSQGRTVGTFQFESAGMQKYLRELQPSVFEDLIAMNALYRPGPMDYIPEFIERKQGRKPIEYDIPIMERYLKDTYGVTVYQEQVMLLSRLLANFTRGQSDSLRKAMGKKLISKMNELETLFYEGGQKNGHPRDVLEKIWTDWKKFASYAFNKSHATCYSWVAYQTGYLKAHYPAEYMAAVLTHNRADSAKLTNFMDECKAMGLVVKGPDVNESVRDFGVTAGGKSIRYGLSAISGIGDSVVEEIVKVRGNEPFKDIYDFLERVPSRAINRRVFENLALAGAFDCFEGYKREDLVNEMSGRSGESIPEQLLRYGALHQSAQLKNEASLFDFDDETLNTEARPKIPSALPWNKVTLLDKERELVGKFLSAHPLDPYYLDLTYGAGINLAQFADFSPREGSVISYGGIVTSAEERLTRKGSKMMIVKLEDFTGATDFVMFQEQARMYAHLCQVGEAIFVRGHYATDRSGTLRFNLDGIAPLDTVKGTLIQKLCITTPITEQLTLVRDLVREQLTKRDGYRVHLAVRLYDPEIDRSLTLNSGKQIFIDRAFIEQLTESEIQFNLK